MKTHSPLKYYREQQELLNRYIPKINNMYYDIQEFIDDDDMFNDICRWSDVTLTLSTIKIDFSFISREEYTAIKNALNLNKMIEEIDKESKTYTMTAELNGITIRFYWNLPDTCEIIREYEYTETSIKPEDLKVEENKVLRRTEKTISVKCGDKSMLESVFAESEVA